VVLPGKGLNDVSDDLREDESVDGAGDWILGSMASETRAPVKSAQRLAGDIEDWILALRLEPKSFLGSERDLIERFGVSRAVFREAIRIVEFDGLAMMKRGPSGGLFSSSPDGDAVTHALSVCLRYLSTDVADIYESRLTIETRCAGLAAARITEKGRRVLEEIVEREGAAVEMGDRSAYLNCVRDFHIGIADLSQNHFLSLVVRSLFELTEQLSPWPSDLRRIESMVNAHIAHVKIAEAIFNGDEALATMRMRSHTNASHSYNEATRKTLDAASQNLADGAPPESEMPIRVEELNL
jgi:DNA-binding FadR family transcriptional regulator